MAKRMSEMVRIEPLLSGFTTAAATSVQKINISPNAYKISVLCHVNCGTNSTGASATAANYVQFSVIEATAASANGSAITGATMTLGAATAYQARGVYSALLRVSSVLTTAMAVTINGISYQATAAGAGGEGEAAAAMLASAINGKATSRALPHYVAVNSYGATGNILIEPSDDKAGGLTIETTGGTGLNFSMISLQGMIDISADKFSTNTPKYIGVLISTAAGTTNVVNAFLVRQPTGSPSFPGRVISLTT
jgi:hypothetical protein